VARDFHSRYRIEKLLFLWSFKKQKKRGGCRHESGLKSGLILPPSALPLIRLIAEYSTKMCELSWGSRDLFVFTLGYIINSFPPYSWQIDFNAASSCCDFNKSSPDVALSIKASCFLLSPFSFLLSPFSFLLSFFSFFSFSFAFLLFDFGDSYNSPTHLSCSLFPTHCSSTITGFSQPCRRLIVNFSDYHPE